MVTPTQKRTFRRTFALEPAGGSWTPSSGAEPPIVGGSVPGGDSGALEDHIADANPHPVYLTQAEADALYAALALLPLAASVAVTVPANSIVHSETVTFTGCTAARKLLPALAPHLDSDENSPEMLDIGALSAEAGTDQAVITLSFREPTSGAIKLNLMAV